MPTNTFKVGEMLNRRSPCSKTWINFDGSYTVETFDALVHFEDCDGNQHNIETFLFDEADLDSYEGPYEKYGKDVLEAAKQRAKEDKETNTLDRNLYDYQGVKVPFKAIIPRNIRRGYTIGRGDDDLHFIPVNSSPSIGYIDTKFSNKVYYQDVWNDSDVCLELKENGIKETIILKTDKSPSVFSFEVKGSLEDDLTTGSLKIESAWLEDATGTTRDVQQVLRTKGDITYLDLIADTTGLEYPIYIDPTIIIQDDATKTKDTYAYSGKPEDNYGSSTTLKVGTDYYDATHGTGKAFIQMDLSPIPFNSKILSASLDLNIGVQSANAQTINLKRVTSRWDEMTLTWKTMPTNDEKVYASVRSDVPGGTAKFDMKEILQEWVNGVYPNFGVLLDGSTAVNTSVLITSSNAPESGANVRPKLTVTYNSPPSAPKLKVPNGGETWNSTHTVEWESSYDLEYEPKEVGQVNSSADGNQMIRLDDGRYVCITGGTDGQGKTTQVNLLDDRDATSTNLCYISDRGGTSAIQSSLVYLGGSMIGVFVTRSITSSSILSFYSIDINTVTNTDLYGTGFVVDNKFKLITGISAIVNSYSTEIHVTYTGQGTVDESTIRYRKGVIGTDKKVTWEDDVRVTNATMFTSWEKVSIVLNKDQSPVIICSYEYNAAEYKIQSITKNSATWTVNTVYDKGKYKQRFVKSIYVPQSINGLPNGRIWATWIGSDSSSAKTNVFVSYSDDGGITWSVQEQLTKESTYSQTNPSISTNYLNEIIILWEGKITGLSDSKVSNIYSVKNTAGSWGQIMIAAEENVSNGSYKSPFVYYDPKFRFKQQQPIFIYQSDVLKKAYVYGFFGTRTKDLQYHIQLTSNNGASWKDIVALTQAGVTSYTYDFINETASPFSKIRIRAYDGYSFSDWDESDGVFTIIHNLAPTMPTNLQPSGIAVDRQSTIRFSWQHNDPNVNDPQSKFDLQWRLQDTSTWNSITRTTTTNFYDIPANTLPIGTIEWQVRTYDQAGLSGPYSSIAVFNAANKPDKATIVMPTDGEVIPIANPVVQWSHPAQTDYWLRILDETGTRVVWDEQKTSVNKAKTIPYNLANQTKYKIQVAVKDAYGLWSDFETINVTISYTVPPLPSVSATKDDKRGSITISITNPVSTGTEPKVIYNDVYRKENNGTFIRIGKVNANSIFVDYTPLPKTILTYYVIAYGDNGAFANSSIISTSVSVSHTQISSISNPNMVVSLQKRTDGTETNSIESEKMQFAGRAYPMTEFGTQMERAFEYSYKVFSLEEMLMMRELASIGETLLLRDNRGRKDYVTISNITIVEKPILWEINIKPEKVYYAEEV